MKNKIFTIFLIVTTIICCGTLLLPLKAQTLSATCGAPDTLATDSITSTSALVNWTSIPEAQSYHVAYKPYGATTTWTHLTVNDTHANLTGLTPSTKYAWVVNANCNDTTGHTTPVGYFTTLPGCVPPTGLKKEDVTLNSVKINWNAVIGAKGYWVAYKNANNVNAQWKYKGVSETSTYLTDLRPSTRYVWMVGTRCFDMPTDYSEQAYFTTAGECIAPRDRSHYNLTSTSVTVRWDTVGDADSYYVAYKSTTASAWSYKAVSGTRTTLWNLTPSTNYVWIVASYCGNKISDYSANEYFTTKGTAGRTATVYDEENTSRSLLNLEAYPNPSNLGDKLTVSFTLQQAGEVQLSLTDLQGSKKVTQHTRKLEAGRHDITLGSEALTTGFYILELQAGQTLVRQKQIVIQH